jgi:ATP phosphoribosyltransferase
VLYKVADGTVQTGITGLDVVMEHQHQDVIIIQDRLGYGHCSLVVAVPETWVDVENMADVADVALDFREFKRRNLRIATKYPTLTRRFLNSQGIHHYTLVKAEGAIEAAPILGYADMIVDLSQTGTTLRENHLKSLPDGSILESQACLIGNRSALKNDPNILETVRLLLEYMDGALQGRGYCEIIANIQGEDAESIARKVVSNPITRGLQGPTIAPIYGTLDAQVGKQQWYTATIIVDSKNLFKAVEHLRSIGGTQTIVSPVRYVFLEHSPTFARLISELEIDRR